MNKKLFLGLSLLLALPLSAQDIYKLELMSGEDLNGTARFVGMGGAMSSLGADISTMGTNPAGIGLYRRSDISLSGGFVSQPSAQDFAGRGKTHASFDQAGFVYSAKLGGSVKYFNFGFNYHKRRNLNSFAGASGDLGGLSQSLEMLDLAQGLDLTNNDDRGYTTPLTLGGYDTHMLDDEADADGNWTGSYTPVSSQSYAYNRARWGGVQQYDFNFAMNVNDVFYAGLTLGLYHVDINSRTDYAEAVINTSNSTVHDYFMSTTEALTGSGYDVKLGMIFRPIEDSPFRFGVAVHTPIFFDLTSRQDLYMSAPFQQFDDDGNVTKEYTEKMFSRDAIGDNSYKVRTPWRFNLSAATTIGNYLALDAEYEYRNFSASQVRYGETRWDDWGGPYKSSYKDDDICQQAKQYLKPVSTFRIGLEAKPVKNVSLRVGYNYETAPMSKKAFLNLLTPNTSAYHYACNTDYVNLGAINRVTFGVGFKASHFYCDFAYQYQNQKGDLYAFHVPTATSNEDNRLTPAKVDFSRHQALLTLGYRF